MKKEIDFSNAIRNPYVDKNLKRQITINLNGRAIDYFKDMASKKGVPYQTLINIFLNDCVDKKLDISVI
ncbi:antitoxin (plasmid) [Campylobacter fetus]|uniref:Antitoxin n=1 Tax=Campylobacter fetus TaxID=196 RepID=A0A974RKV3_CAMFE|nr:antitoxin [Campylobacter fetus]OCS32546.1 antitoxin [Campylobacter fetus subsp. venerealis]QMS59952.1 antitoxin [Campylobacter fetus]